jgi:chorismate mutase
MTTSPAAAEPRAAAVELQAAAAVAVESQAVVVGSAIPAAGPDLHPAPPATAAAPRTASDPAAAPDPTAASVPATASDPSAPPPPQGVSGGRARIDALDAELIELIRRRVAVSAEIQSARISTGGRRLDLRRETEVIGRYTQALGRPGTSVAMALLELGRGRV